MDSSYAAALRAHEQFEVARQAALAALHEQREEIDGRIRELQALGKGTASGGKPRGRPPKDRRQQKSEGRSDAARAQAPGRGDNAVPSD